MTESIHGASPASSHSDSGDKSNSKKRASAGDESSGPQKVTKRRAARACVSCRARKVRCDVVEGAPCGNCRWDNVEVSERDSDFFFWTAAHAAVFTLFLFLILNFFFFSFLDAWQANLVAVHRAGEPSAKVSRDGKSPAPSCILIRLPAPAPPEMPRSPVLPAAFLPMWPRTRPIRFYRGGPQCH